MAYVSKETKAELVKAVKAVLPKGWKATFSVRNYSTFICTIRQAPVDLKADFGSDRDYLSINEYYIEKHCENKELVEILTKISRAMQGLNYDNSDPMTDYFDVGYYTEMRFGEWDKPFVSTK